MMQKKLYIHIGGPKTGSSALQDFLSRNRPVLESRGFFYPGTGQAHREICEELKAHTASELQTLPDTFVGRWTRDMERSSCHTHILSAECFAGMGGGEKLRKLISPEFQVRVVYYARRQDALIESWYNESVKCRRVRLKDKLDEDLLQKYFRAGAFDHMRVVMSWAEAFGRENIIVRCYEKAQMPAGIIEDFSRLVGLSVDSALWIPAKSINKSLDIPHTEFIRLCSLRLKDETDIGPLLYWSHFQHSRILQDTKKRHLLSPGARTNILNHFEESNQRVARDCLGRDDGRLFSEPWPDPDEPWEPYEGLTVEELVPIVTELIYRQGQREQAGQPLQTFLGIANTLLKKVPGAFPSDNHAAVAHPDGRERMFPPECPATSAADLEILQKSRTVEELVPLVAKIMSERNQLNREKQPLATVFVLVNHLLSRAVALIPLRKRQRLGHRYCRRRAGSWIKDSSSISGDRRPEQQRLQTLPCKEPAGAGNKGYLLSGIC